MRIIWGTSEPKWINAEILNLPEGVLKVRRKMRNKCEMQLFLKFKDRIEHWIPERDGDKLKLWILRGINK